MSCLDGPTRHRRADVERSCPSTRQIYVLTVMVAGAGGDRRPGSRRTFPHPWLFAPCSSPSCLTSL